MSYAPQTILDLQSYWTKQGGRALGIVGDLPHAQKGVSYHLGKDHLVSGAYSARLPRDKAGLTNAASAIDLGRLNNSLTKLWEFSRWFAQQCMDRKPGYKDVREVIFWSPIRNRVIGWSALDPHTFINDYGDSSHKTHTHISYYRDSENRPKTAMFMAYPAFKPVPAPTPEEDMILTAYLAGYAAVVQATANIRVGPSMTAKVIRGLTSPEAWVLTGLVKGDVDPEGGSDQWYVRWNTDHWEYTAFSNVPVTPVAPASPVELAAARLAAEKAQAQAAAAKTDLAACNVRVVKAKAALA